MHIIHLIRYKAENKLVITHLFEMYLSVSRLLLYIFNITNKLPFIVADVCVIQVEACFTNRPT